MAGFACWGQIMQRLFLSAAILLSASASAQTSINITLPGTQGSCTYTTGPVLSNSVPGQLQATATTAPVGAGCGTSGGGVGFGPASPLAPTTTTLTSAGGAANLSFQAINATLCTGSITGAAGGVFTVGGTTTATFCSSSASCATAQSFSTSFPANADTVNDKQAIVTASCQGASGSPITSTATITVPHNGGGLPPPTGCTAPPVIAGATGTLVPTFTRLETNVTAQYGGGPGGGAHSIDPRSFASIYFSAWPGEVWTSTITLSNSKYISAAFTVPSNYFTALNAPVGPPLPGMAVTYPTQRKRLYRSGQHDDQYFLWRFQQSQCDGKHGSPGLLFQQGHFFDRFAWLDR